MKFARVFLAYLVLCSGAYAQVGQIPSWPPIQPAAAAGCAEATTFLARTSGLNGTHTTAYTNLICGLVTDAVFSKFDALYIFATQDTTTAQLSLVSSAFNVTLVNGPTFTTDRGYTGNGINQNINTNFNPTTAPSPKYVNNNQHISLWNLTNQTQGAAAMGGNGSGTAIYPNFSGTDCFTRLDDSGGSVTIGAPTGHILGTRSVSTARTTYQNGGSLGTVTVTSGATPSANMLFLGDGVGFSTFQISGGSIGSSLTGTDVTNFYNRLRTYMTAVGVP